MRRDNLHCLLERIRKKINFVSRTFLWRLVDGSNGGANPERDVIVFLVFPVHKPEPLAPRCTPVVEKPIENVGIFKHDVVHMAVRLTVQRHRTRLTLGTNSLRPNATLRATLLDLTVNILQRDELPLVHAGLQPFQIGMEGEMFGGWVQGFEVFFVVRFKRRTVETLAQLPMLTQLRVFLAMDEARCIGEDDVDLVLMNEWIT